MTDDTLTTNPSAAWFRHQVEAVYDDLLKTIGTHWPAVGSQLIAHSLIETCGAVLAAIVREAPASAPDIDAKLAALRQFVVSSQAHASSTRTH